VLGRCDRVAGLFQWFYKGKGAEHKPYFGAADLLKYIGPGFLVTVGFIDPGNWASNFAAGANYGYALLWMVTLSTIMLILLQHNVAHLGIATGLCLSEATTLFIPKPLARAAIGSAMFATVATSLAEVIGTAIALNMLFRIPIRIGAILAVVLALVMIFANTYTKVEKWIIGFVSIIALSFLYELALAHIDWKAAGYYWLAPSIPRGSMVIVMSVLGAVVMPHNLFLHSEIIQSRQWNLENEKLIKRQLNYEFLDTLVSMIVGWAINSAMILIAASTFFQSGTRVSELQQTYVTLRPLLGGSAQIVFAIALLFSGIASSITAGIAAGSIFAGFYGEPYNIQHRHSRVGVAISLLLALAAIFAIDNPFQGLIYSQMLLSIQLPITIGLQIYLTSSKRVMKNYVNGPMFKISLLIVGAIVIILNLKLLASLF
jgi:manganese transport protein